MERARLGHVLEMLEAGEVSKSIAHKAGLKSDAAFRSACSDAESLRHYSIIPPSKPIESREMELSRPLWLLLLKFSYRCFLSKKKLRSEKAITPIDIIHCTVQYQNPIVDNNQ